MEINSEIALSNIESQFYKKFKNLSVNEQPLPQGDGAIRISPFDDYVLITLYDEIGGTNVPLDLSNVGTLYLVFIGGNDEIRIPNFTNVKDLDQSAGQVLFRISRDESRKILALDNNIFYISSMMVDSDGKSDESVLYTGTFLSFSDSASISLTKKLEDAQIQYSKDLAQLQTKVNQLNQEIISKDNLIAEQAAIINSLRESNINLANEISVLNDQLPTTLVEKLLLEAKEILKAEENAKLARQQILTSQESNKASQTGSKLKSYFTQASNQLAVNVPGANPLGSGGTVPPTPPPTSFGGGGGSQDSAPDGDLTRPIDIDVENFT